MKRIGKKLIIGVMALVMSLAGATSAFAYDGWADSLPTAYQLQAPIFGVSTFIDSPADVDWFSWTNDSGTAKAVTGTLTSPSGKNYDLIMVAFNNGTPITVPAIDNGVGNNDEGTASLEPGETIYFQVRGHDITQFSSTETYIFSISFK
ncbi:hypothetical protein D3P09_03575 [Paenibacillus pinisoli]|uniref:DUF3992 domain-containing protein n=1 Tax=Paenibacillus pinisoli TaxID=1276110 RepID=A0A3A6PMZ6_9BACL|nr:hypothetical protein [Paenibacillus pinisoli]RJX41096.1 hypothetical protein D3P09_03575 [Paenibacillus pinisoli]